MKEDFAGHMGSCTHTGTARGRPAPLETTMDAGCCGSPECTRIETETVRRTRDALSKLPIPLRDLPTHSISTNRGGGVRTTRHAESRPTVSGCKSRGRERYPETAKTPASKQKPAAQTTAKKKLNQSSAFSESRRIMPKQLYDTNNDIAVDAAGTENVVPDRDNDDEDPVVSGQCEQSISMPRTTTRAMPCFGQRSHR